VAEFGLHVWVCMFRAGEDAAGTSATSCTQDTAKALGIKRSGHHAKLGAERCACSRSVQKEKEEERHHHPNESREQCWAVKAAGITAPPPEDCSVALRTSSFDGTEVL